MSHPASLPFIDDAFIGAHLDYAGVQRAIESAFTSLSEGRAAIQARARTECGGFRLSTMGAACRDMGLSLVKTYGTVQGRFDFVCNLFDTTTGAPLAVMQGNELTRFRTPALTCLAVARAAARTRRLALFGAGAQGKAHAEALLQAFAFEEVRVVDMQDVSAWCAQMAQRFPGCAFMPSGPGHAVRGADVVVTATRAKEPVFDGDWLEPHALVAAIGTSLPTGSELDERTLRRASRIIVEWKPQSLTEAGEVVAGRRWGALDEERIVDLTEIADLSMPWRRPSDGVLVFKAVGVGLTDLAAASLAWKAWGARSA